MGMIISYRNNTDLIRKKRIFKNGKSYFRAKQEYRKAAGDDKTFRTASPQERALIRSKIYRERRREKILISLVSVISISIAIWLTIALWPSVPRTHKINQFTVTASDYNEFNNYMSQGNGWMVKNEWYNAVFEYDKGYSIILRNHSTISQNRLKLEYIDHLTLVNPANVLDRVNQLILKYPNRI